MEDKHLHPIDFNELLSEEERVNLPYHSIEIIFNKSFKYVPFWVPS